MVVSDAIATFTEARYVVPTDNSRSAPPRRTAVSRIIGISKQRRPSISPACMVRIFVADVYLTVMDIVPSLKARATIVTGVHVLDGASRFCYTA